jgi:transposase InsO family protein
MPHKHLSDNGGQFTSKFFQKCCTLLGIKQGFTTTYHPQCNGQVERFNRTILAQLRAYVGEYQNDWDLYHEALTFAYNTQVHTSTGISRFELTLSRPPTPMAMEPVAAIQSNNNPKSKSGPGTLVGGPADVVPSS